MSMQMDDCKIAVSYAACSADTHISPFKLRLVNVTAYWAVCLYIVSAISYTDIYIFDKMKSDFSYSFNFSWERSPGHNLQPRFKVPHCGVHHCMRQYVNVIRL